MKYAFAAALLQAAYATTIEAAAEAEWEQPSYYYYAPAASVTNRNPHGYASAFTWDFDKIDDAAEEVYFGTDSESEINGETDDSWSSHEGYTDPDSDSSGARTSGPDHRNSSDDSDCDTWNPCTSDQHSHSSESLHDATDSHCHDSDSSDCSSHSDSSSHYSHSSSDTYSHSSSHSNDSSYPFSSSSDGIPPQHDFRGDRVIGGYTSYSGFHGNGRYEPNRYYTSYH